MSFVDQYGPWAVVTGAAARVVLAFAEELHARGLRIVMVDVDPRRPRRSSSRPPSSVAIGST